LGMAPGIEMYVVHLIRDPRAAAYSWLKEPRPDADERSYMNRVNTVKSSMLCDVWNVSSEALWRGSPERYMRLRYEDFVAEPRRAVESILGMLGENADQLPLIDEREVELGVGHTVAGNPNRFRSGTVRLRLDEEWASRMRPRDRRLVTLLTLPLLARYGYPVLTEKTAEG
ncbi:MAG: sulfotransferase, partial [Rubrobacter sp.]|nr:sulfotransferase [Rubrobacter sp.]